jgi:hypothetical protein
MRGAPDRVVPPDSGLFGFEAESRKRDNDQPFACDIAFFDESLEAIQAVETPSPARPHTV